MADEEPIAAAPNSAEVDREQPPRKKMNRVAKMAIVVAVTGLILIVLLAGAGVAYTYFLGSKPIATTPAPVTVKPQTNLPTSNKVYADDAPVGVSIQTLATPVVPGDNSSVAIKTLPTAKCTIDVQYNNVKSTDSGLVEKTADEYGVTSWSWTVPAGTPFGSWPVNISCTHGVKSAVVAGTLVVAASVEN